MATITTVTGLLLRSSLQRHRCVPPLRSPLHNYVRLLLPWLQNVLLLLRPLPLLLSLPLALLLHPPTQGTHGCCCFCHGCDWWCCACCCRYHRPLTVFAAAAALLLRPRRWLLPLLSLRQPIQPKLLLPNRLRRLAAADSRPPTHARSFRAPLRGGCRPPDACECRARRPHQTRQIRSQPQDLTVPRPSNTARPARPRRSRLAPPPAPLQSERAEQSAPCRSFRLGDLQTSLKS